MVELALAVGRLRFALALHLDDDKPELEESASHQGPTISAILPVDPVAYYEEEAARFGFWSR